MLQPLTVDENSFHNPKPRHAALVAYKALADIAGKGSLFVVTVVAARRLSADAFGIFALGSTLGWMLAVAADWGMQMHLARAVARTPHAAARLLTAWLRIRAWTMVGSIAVALAAMAAWRLDASAAAPIALLTVAYACSGLVEFFYYFFRGLSRSDVEASVTLWHRLGTLGVALAALAWRPTVAALGVAMLVPAAIAAIVCWRIAVRAAGRSEQSEDRSSQGAMGGEFRRDVFPIGAGIVISAMYFRIDVFLVEAWSGTASVALYNAVFRLVEALRLFPAAVLAVTLPMLCRASDTRPLARVSVVVTAFAVVVAALLWLNAPWIVPLVYGGRFAGATSAFRILLLAFPLMSLNYALTHQLIAWDGHRAFAVVCAAALAFNVLLNARLIPLLSIDGAAWTTLGTEIVLTIGCLVALVKTTRTSPAPRSMVFAEDTPGATLCPRASSPSLAA